MIELQLRGPGFMQSPKFDKKKKRKRDKKGEGDKFGANLVLINYLLTNIRL